VPDARGGGSADSYRRELLVATEQLAALKRKAPAAAAAAAAPGAELAAAKRAVEELKAAAATAQLQLVQSDDVFGEIAGRNAELSRENAALRREAALARRSVVELVAALNLRRSTAARWTSSAPPSLLRNMSMAHADPSIADFAAAASVSPPRAGPDDGEQRGGGSLPRQTALYVAHVRSSHGVLLVSGGADADEAGEGHIPEADEPWPWGAGNISGADLADAMQPPLSVADGGDAVAAVPVPQSTAIRRTGSDTSSSSNGSSTGGSSASSSESDSGSSDNSSLYGYESHDTVDDEEEADWDGHRVSDGGAALHITWDLPDTAAPSPGVQPGAGHAEHYADDAGDAEEWARHVDGFDRVSLVRWLTLLRQVQAEHEHAQQRAERRDRRRRRHALAEHDAAVGTKKRPGGAASGFFDGVGADATQFGRRMRCSMSDVAQFMAALNAAAAHRADRAFGFHRAGGGGGGDDGLAASTAAALSALDTAEDRDRAERGMPHAEAEYRARDRALESLYHALDQRPLRYSDDGALCAVPCPSCPPLGIHTELFARTAIGEADAATTAPAARDPTARLNALQSLRRCNRATLARSLNALDAGFPRVGRLVVAGNCVEGGALYVQYDYSGAEEGPSVVRWYRLGVTHDGTSTGREALTLLAQGEGSVVCTTRDVGCYVVAEVSPIRIDGVVGAPAVARSPMLVQSVIPVVQRLRIAGAGKKTAAGAVGGGEVVYGTTVRASYDFVGGTEGGSAVRWYKSRDGKAFTLVATAAAPSTELPLTVDVLHHFLRVQVAPVRHDDGVKGNVVISKMVYVVLDDRADALLTGCLAAGFVEFADVSRLLPRPSFGLYGEEDDNRSPNGGGDDTAAPGGGVPGKVVMSRRGIVFVPTDLSNRKMGLTERWDVDADAGLDRFAVLAAAAGSLAEGGAADSTGFTWHAFRAVKQSHAADVSEPSVLLNQAQSASFFSPDVATTSADGRSATTVVQFRANSHADREFMVLAFRAFFCAHQRPVLREWLAASSADVAGEEEELWELMAAAAGGEAESAAHAALRRRLQHVVAVQRDDDVALLDGVAVDRGGSAPPALRGSMLGQLEGAAVAVASRLGSDRLPMMPPSTSGTLF
jgi:hypothetical protein